MTPTLFAADYLDAFEPGQAVTFPDHGICDLTGILEGYCEQTADDGSEWEMVFKFYASEDWANEIQYNRIVVVKANTYQRPQAFRIYSITKQTDTIVEVKAQHISYDLANDPVKPFSSTSPSVALQKLQSEAAFPTKFIFSTDVETDDSFEFTEPKSMRKILLDGDDSIAGTYGGDLVIDNCDIQLLQVGGEDRGVSIEYGVDLVDITQEENITEMVTGIMPYFKRNSSNSQQTLKESRKELKPKSTEWGGQDWIENTYIRSDTGAAVSFTPVSTAKYWASPLVTVIDTSDLTKRFSVIFPQVRAAAPTNVTKIGYAFYDAQQHYITGQAFTEVAKQPIVAVPDDAKYLRVTKETYTHDQIPWQIVRQDRPDPLIYGDPMIINGPGTYQVPKIVSVDLSKYFVEEDKEPTPAELSAKAREWVAKEDIGKPEVSLTLGYEQIDQDIRMFDAVRVRFPKLNVDVKSKVTKYKFDFLRERVEEIEVGSTKESPFFTLSDASRLKKGLLPPNRIEDYSITSSKYGGGSVGKGAIDQGSVGEWELEDFSIDRDKLREKAINVLHLGEDIAETVADVQGNEGWRRKKVARILSSQLGIPAYILDPKLAAETPSSTPGEEDDPTKSTYNLNVDFIKDGSINGNDKIEDSSINGDDKIEEESISEKLFVDELQTKIAKIDTLEAKTANIEMAESNVVKINNGLMVVTGGVNAGTTYVRAGSLYVNGSQYVARRVQVLDENEEPFWITVLGI